MYKLKIADKSDLMTVLRLSEELFRSSIYAKHTVFDIQHVTEMFLATLELEGRDVCTLILSKDNAPIGFIVMAAHPASFANQKIATELAFYILPAFRNYRSLRELQKAYYYWARLVGCKYITQGKLKDADNTESYTFRRLK